MRALLLAALLALLALAAPAAAQERVSFLSNDSDLTGGAPTRLDGLLYAPAGAGPHPAIVLLHGCGGLYREDRVTVTGRHADWAKRLARQGYAALHVDSFSPRGFAEICRVKGRSILPRLERARDAYGALLYLQSRADISADRIGLMGWSNGGSATLWTVAEATKARPAALPKGDFAAAVAFYPGCRGALESRTRWTTRIPLLVLVGAADDWTPAEPCHALVEREKSAGAKVELILYPEAHHGFDAPNQPIRVLENIATTASGTATIGTNKPARDDSLRRVAAFFAQHLRN